MAKREELLGGLPMLRYGRLVIFIDAALVEYPLLAMQVSINSVPNIACGRLCFFKRGRVPHARNDSPAMKAEVQGERLGSLLPYCELRRAFFKCTPPRFSKAASEQSPAKDVVASIFRCACLQLRATNAWTKAIATDWTHFKPAPVCDCSSKPLPAGSLPDLLWMCSKAPLDDVSATDFFTGNIKT
ncbi:hypothetical protein FQR65_LT20562 [Abscondita terminalis]|nr:hypothetical protein FQR65_LT20562 [Abscondita terminalis]